MHTTTCSPAAASPHTHVVVNRAGDVLAGPGTIGWCYDTALDWPDCDDVQVAALADLS